MPETEAIPVPTVPRLIELVVVGVCVCACVVRIEGVEVPSTLALAIGTCAVFWGLGNF